MGFVSRSNGLCLRTVISMTQDLIIDLGPKLLLPLPPDQGVEGRR
jgi:hypothetical protein